MGGLHWVLAARKHLLPRPLRMKRRPVDQRSCGRLLARIGKNVQLLLRAVVLTGKAQQFEQKSAAPGVQWLLAQLLAKRLDGWLQLSSTIKRQGIHNRNLLV